MAKSAPTRQPKDFNQLKPDDIEITNPDRAAQEAAGIPVDVEYPKHLHRFAGVGLPHEYVEVTNAKEEAAAKRDGYGSAQEADADQRDAKAELEAAKAPKRAKPAKAADVAPAAAAAPTAKKPKGAKAPKKAKPGESAAN